MKLVVNELQANSGDGSLFQTLTVRSTSPLVVAALKPHLLRYGSPSGSLYMEIRKNSDSSLLATSETIAISSIPSGNYWHGYVKFATNCVLAASEVVDVWLKFTGGYVFAEPAYIAWATDYETRRYTATHSPVGWFDSPLDLEIHEYKLVTKGTYP